MRAQELAFAREELEAALDAGGVQGLRSAIQQAISVGVTMDDIDRAKEVLAILMQREDTLERVQALDCKDANLEDLRAALADADRLCLMGPVIDVARARLKRLQEQTAAERNLKAALDKQDIAQVQVALQQAEAAGVEESPGSPMAAAREMIAEETTRHSVRQRLKALSIRGADMCSSEEIRAAIACAQDAGLQKPEYEQAEQMLEQMEKQAQAEAEAEAEAKAKSSAEAAKNSAKAGPDPWPHEDSGLQKTEDERVEQMMEQVENRAQQAEAEAESEAEAEATSEEESTEANPPLVRHQDSLERKMSARERAAEARRRLRRQGSQAPKRDKKSVLKELQEAKEDEDIEDLERLIPEAEACGVDDEKVEDAKDKLAEMLQLREEARDCLKELEDRDTGKRATRSILDDTLEFAKRVKLAPKEYAFLEMLRQDVDGRTEARERLQKARERANDLSIPVDLEELSQAIADAKLVGIAQKDIDKALQVKEQQKNRQELEERIQLVGEGEHTTTEELEDLMDKVRLAVLDEGFRQSAEEKILEAMENKEVITAVERELLHIIKEVEDNLHDTIEEMSDDEAMVWHAMQRAQAAGCSQQALGEAERLRRRLHNRILDAKGAIRVFLRVRPLSKKEIAKGSAVVMHAKDSMTVSLNRKKHGLTHQDFKCDAVFVPGTQEEVFEECKGLVQSAIDGYNITLLTYGQTGAGKTYTMYGMPGKEGTAQRTCREVFRLIDQDGDRYNSFVSASLMELYKDDLIDLLDGKYVGDQSKGDRRSWDSAATNVTRSWGLQPPTPRSKKTKVEACSSSRSVTSRAPRTGDGKPGKDKKKLPVHFENTDDDGQEGRRFLVTVEGLSEVPCSCVEELLEALYSGMEQRKVSATDMNSQSSRSHLLFTIKIKRVCSESGETTQGKIMSCDLAGSERLNKSKVQGNALQESIAINKSLSALGDVIEALNKGKKAAHVPYRNHKLTEVMADALGGTSKTLMFVNCSPADSNVEETSNSLKYAGRLVNMRHMVRAGARSSIVTALAARTQV